VDLHQLQDAIPVLRAQRLHEAHHFKDAQIVSDKAGEFLFVELLRLDYADQM